ncbi:MAG: 1,4-dihydroxy-2-naphthoate polyprenyltransferase [Actinomycetota bacterium]
MNVWVEAARPRTLPASVAPVIVGTLAAQRFIAWRALCALIVSVALQVAVNYANDLFDGRRGIDTAARVGPRRAVASGLVTPRAMGRAVVAALVVAAIAGIVLAAAAGWELLLVGAAAILAALGYSGGPRPYASAALGEVMVFVFFGLVATIGSAYVQDGSVRAVPVLASVPIGALAAAILVVNNLRDISTDATAGKVTLAVRLGERRTVTSFRVLMVVALVSLVPLALVEGPMVLLAAAAFVLWPGVSRGVREGAEPPMLIAALGATARLQLVFAGLLGVGLWISN